MDNMSKFTKKAERKQKRIKSMLKNHGVESVDYPTSCLLVGNAGLVCGVQRETLMEVFSHHGLVQNILMIPEKSYAFVVYQDKESAVKAMDHIHGQKINSENFNGTLYLCYVEGSTVPNKTECPIGKYPPGLVLLEDFVTVEEEDKLLSVVSCEQSGECSLKHRKVKHFGYEFNYGTNNIDKNKPIEERIPEICYPHLQKLKALGYISKLPDQLTVNTYKPGQGIPPHVDTHSAFEDGIISLSLGSQTIMDFYHPEGKHVSVLLPRRSLLIMTGESRYLWKHGITPRKTDVISVSNIDGNHLTLVHRLQRTSFTFRIIHQGNCNCTYKDQCDSQKECRPKPTLMVAKKEARILEKQHVYEVYEKIADHFSDTRHKPWPCVANFLSSLSAGSVLVDVGCGNGKYLGRSNHLFEVGCDFCVKLIRICYQRGVEVIASDCLSLPFRNDCADACICIAVIHHMSTEERRRGAVEEIVRILKPGGKALVYVWALEQEGPEGPSNYLSFSKIAKKSQHCIDTNVHAGVVQEKLCVSDTVQSYDESQNNTSFSSQQFQTDTTSLKNGSNCFMNIPIHKNRTHFEYQDILVPWHKKENIKSNHGVNQRGDIEQIYHRYYHVFTKGELEKLITSVNNVYIQSSYYDKGNWCVLFEKL